MKKFASILVAGAMLLGVLTGCGSKDASDPGSSQPAADAGQSQTQTVSGSVSTNGSTSMEKVIGSLSEQFMTENKDVKVTYDATGSGTGIESVSNGSCDIGLASRALKDTETGLMATTVALDGIAIVVNANCGVDDLTVEQIASIFKGEITNWKEVGGADLEIACIGREAGSGTRDGFESITGTEDEALRKSCAKRVPVPGKKNQYQKETDYDLYLGKLAVACTVFPNLNDKELQDSYKVMGADALLKTMLTPGEYAEYLTKIQEVCGFDTTMQDEVDEAKN